MTQTLLDMLTYMRPMGSRAEQKFRQRFLLNLPGATVDPWRNIRVQVGAEPGKVLWSCHTDTVHHHHGRQRVSMLADGTIGLALSSLGSATCLGADDTVGCYLMREMILQGVPGTYVFHHGEERGGIGSSAIALYDRPFLQQFDCAIALDRQGTGDIIVSQMGRCASHAFAASVADELSHADDRLAYKACSGVYTDTAEYADIIPECSNLSVGYKGQHTRAETVDSHHVARLRKALFALNTDAFVIARNPADDAIPAWQRGLFGDWRDDLHESDIDYCGGVGARWDTVSETLDEDSAEMTNEQCRDLYDRYMAEQREMDRARKGRKILPMILRTKGRVQ